MQYMKQESAVFQTTADHTFGNLILMFQCLQIIFYEFMKVFLMQYMKQVMQSVTESSKFISYIST